MKKTAIALALATAAFGAQADSIVSLSIEDIGFSGIGTSAIEAGAGAFYFATGGFLANGTTSGASTFTSDGTDAAGMIMGKAQADGEMSAGFEFGGVGPGFQFFPNTVAGAPTGSVNSDGSGFTVDLSGFGGFYVPFNTQFPLFPDGVDDGDVLDVDEFHASALGAGSLAANEFYYTMDWTHTLTPAEGGFAFANQIADWHFEGIGTVAAVPVPAAVWLFGSALLGLTGLSRRRTQA